MDGRERRAEEARHDRGEDNDNTLDAPNVAKPVEQVVDFAIIEVILRLQTEFEGGKNGDAGARVVLVVGVDDLLLGTVAEESFLDRLLEEIVPLVLPCEIILLQAEFFAEDQFWSNGIQERLNVREFHVDWHREVLIVIIDDRVATVNYEKRLFEKFLNFFL